MRPAEHIDYLLVGGGLANSLIALAVLERDPLARLVLVERGSALGGNHTWCFHAADVPATVRAAVDPLCVYRWPGYEVRFPNHARTIDEPYAGVSSERLASHVAATILAAPNAELLLSTEAASVGAREVRLASGSTLSATCVIDARGPDEYADRGGCGFQKFVGLELELAEPHTLTRPILIDASCAQRGGFRFFYTLPLAANVVLVEDTTFSRDPEIDLEALTASCMGYAAQRGLRVSRIRRTESGSLPMPWRGEAAPPTPPLRAGYQGGWFHPATGYSFPVAARLAAFVASRSASELFGPEMSALYRDHQKQVRYFYRLNRLLFAWFAEGDEWNVFERFYRLPIGLIRRFYALDTTRLDRARILVGRPPRGFSVRERIARSLAR